MLFINLLIQCSVILNNLWLQMARNSLNHSQTLVSTLFSLKTWTFKAGGASFWPFSAAQLSLASSQISAFDHLFCSVQEGVKIDDGLTKCYWLVVGRWKSGWISGMSNISVSLLQAHVEMKQSQAESISQDLCLFFAACRRRSKRCLKVPLRQNTSLKHVSRRYMPTPFVANRHE